MNKRQSNKYNSYVKLKGVLQANASLYESIPIFKQFVDKFLSLLAELLSLNSEHTHDTTPVTDAKTIAKEKMTRLTSELAAAASAWAHEQNDPVLIGQFDYSYSDIRYARDNEASSISMSVLEELKSNATQLTEYMISEQDTATLEGYINEFAACQSRKER